MGQVALHIPPNPRDHIDITCLAITQAETCENADDAQVSLEPNGRVGAPEGLRIIWGLIKVVAHDLVFDLRRDVPAGILQHRH